SPWGIREPAILAPGAKFRKDEVLYGEYVVVAYVFVGEAVDPALDLLAEFGVEGVPVRDCKSLHQALDFLVGGIAEKSRDVIGCDLSDFLHVVNQFGIPLLDTRFDELVQTDPNSIGKQVLVRGGLQGGVCDGEDFLRLFRGEREVEWNQDRA